MEVKPKTWADALETTEFNSALRKLFAYLYVLLQDVTSADSQDVVTARLQQLVRRVNPSAVAALNPTLITHPSTYPIGGGGVAVLRIYAELKPGLLRSHGLSSFLNEPLVTEVRSVVHLSAFAICLDKHWHLLDVARGAIPGDKLLLQPESEPTVDSVPVNYLRRLTETLGMKYIPAQETGDCLQYSGGPQNDILGIAIPGLNYGMDLQDRGMATKVWKSLHELIWGSLRRNPR